MNRVFSELTSTFLVDNRDIFNIIPSKSTWFILLGTLLVFYFVLVMSAAHSISMQRNLTYLQWTKLWRRPALLKDLRYQGLSINTRNIQCGTSDGITLHGYHMMPARLTAAIASFQVTQKGKNTKRAALDEFFDAHLADAKGVVLYIHGIALDRAFHYRIATMVNLANQFDVHVIAFDYRGFAENEGSSELSESGTRCDARAMEAWLDAAIKRGRLHARTYGLCTQKNVERPIRIIYGHSLGSSVSTYLAGDNSILGHFDGIILNGAFTCAVDAMKCSRLGAPLRWLHPCVMDYVASKWTLVTEGYRTIQYIERVPNSMHVLFIHGEKDAVIPFHLGKELYEKWRSLRAAYESRRGAAVASMEFVAIADAMHSDNFKFAQWTVGIYDFLARIERDRHSVGVNLHGDERMVASTSR